MILSSKPGDTYIKVLLDKRFFTIAPIGCGFLGYEVSLHINHKKGELVEYEFVGTCDSIYVDNHTNPYRSSVRFKFSDYNRFNNPDDVCKYILDNIEVYKYMDQFADDKTICKRLGEKLMNNYID